MDLGRLLAARAKRAASIAFRSRPARPADGGAGVGAAGAAVCCCSDSDSAMAALSCSSSESVSAIVARTETRRMSEDEKKEQHFLTAGLCTVLNMKPAGEHKLIIVFTGKLFKEERRLKLEATALLTREATCGWIKWLSVRFGGDVRPLELLIITELNRVEPGMFPEPLLSRLPNCTDVQTCCSAPAYISAGERSVI